MSARREEAARLRAQGMTFAQIGAALGISRVRAFNLLRPPKPSSRRIMPDDAVIVALYAGGMGAKGTNFYHDLACRYGYAEAADRIQELYLAGKKWEAMAAVPDDLVDDVALCGPKERIAERLELWRNSPITTLNITTLTIEGLRVMAELLL